MIIFAKLNSRSRSAKADGSLHGLFFALAIVIGGAFPSHAQTPQQIEREILGYLQTISKTGTYSGTAYDEEKLYEANRAIKSKLLKFGKIGSFLKYAFTNLKGKIFVATSKDGRLRTYSWDMQTGGTMHDHTVIFQFQGKSGRVHIVSTSDAEESGGPYYAEIFQLNSSRGPIYLATSNFMATSSYNGQSIDAMQIIGDKLDRNAKLIRTRSGIQRSISFTYDLYSVVDRPLYPIKLFTFNETRNEFRFPVVIEDEQTPQGRVTNRFITYRFDGKYFVRVR